MFISIYHYIVIDYFNIEADSKEMSSDTFDPSSLIKEPTCYKNPRSPSCIELILTRKHPIFQHSCVAGTGLPDFYWVILTVTKKRHLKLKPRVIS